MNGKERWPPGHLGAPKLLNQKADEEDTLPAKVKLGCCLPKGEEGPWLDPRVDSLRHLSISSSNSTTS